MIATTTCIVRTTFYAFASLFLFAEANYVVTDKWGQEYCRPSYCGIMDSDGWIKCCERYKKCCAYAEIVFGRGIGPFAYEKEKPILPPVPKTTTSTTTTTTEKPKTTQPPSRPEVDTIDLGGPIEILSPPLAASGDSSGRPASLKLLDQIKPVNIDDHTRPKPKKPSRNDVTYHLPPLHPDVQEIRLEEHQREACRAKFCGVMGVNQWHGCCFRYKTCCAYVDYLSHQANPFYFEAERDVPILT